MLEYLRATQEVKRSARRDRVSARNLYRYFTGKEMGEVNHVAIHGYINARREEKAEPATINRELSLLSAAINHANQNLGWDVRNPTVGRKLREPEGRVRWITASEADRLIAAAESEPRAPYLADFIRMAINTGCRKEELLGLEWERVDLNARLVYLEGAHTKSGKRRSVPINEVAMEALRQRMRFRATHCPSSPWVFVTNKGERVISIWRSFLTACRRAGIEDFRVHDLRHTCATWLITAGAPLPEVRDLLGHSTVKVTERYAHLNPENVRSAVALLDPGSRFSHGGG